jgi:mono/diheme cytochrome c family protein
MIVGLAGGLLGVVGGCRGDREDKPPRQFFPDMDDQPKWGPQSKSEFFADGRTMRLPPNGTVPYGRTPVVSDAAWAHGFMDERNDLLKPDVLTSEGTLADGNYVEKIPMAIDMDLVKRGQERFNIYCAACHNYTGDGKGMVGAQWSYPLPTFHDDKYKKPDPANPAQQTWKDGYIFHTIRYGLVDTAKPGEYKMPPYAHAVSVRDAWAIVAYIRALQTSREGTVNDAPESVRPTLQKQIGQAMEPAGTGGAVASMSNGVGGAR